MVSSFPTEALGRRLSVTLAEEFGPDQLHRTWTRQQLVPGAPHLAHASLAQLLHQPVEAKRQSLVEQRRVDLQHRLPCRGHCTLDQVLQLAHIPWPAVLAQSLHRLLGNRFDHGANPARVLAEEEEGNLRDIVGALCERRDPQLSAFEQRQQLRVESARRSERRRAVRNDAHVGHRRLAALARGLDVLEDFGQPSLQVAGQSLDFFEVQRASGGQLQQAQARA